MPKHKYSYNTTCIPYHALWSNNPSERLNAAIKMPQAAIAKLQTRISQTCPVTAWPYGMPTVLNPNVVVLGTSPGVSPASGDNDYISRPSYEMPTVGTAHPRWHYNDSRGYWDKVRYLCFSLNNAEEPTLDPCQAAALSGHMNLSTEASGQAVNVITEEKLANWVTTVISNHLRPRYVIGVGLTTALKAPEIQKSMSALGRTSVDFTKPTRIKPFDGYPKKNLYFREWDFERPDGRALTLVLWPQHPSRAPFTSKQIWNQSVSEYCEWIGNKPLIQARDFSDLHDESETEH